MMLVASTNVANICVGLGLSRSGASTLLKLSSFGGLVAGGGGTIVVSEVCRPPFVAVDISGPYALEERWTEDVNA